MIRRGYKVFLVLSVMGVAALAQTTTPTTCQEPSRPESPAESLLPLLPIPLLPQVVNTISLLSPAPIAADLLEQERVPEVQSEAFAPLVFSFGSGSYLGIYLEEVTAARAKELGLSEERGAIVMKVVQGSPAEKAGLKENDVIVGFNGRPVDSVKELQRLLSETPEGRSVSIEVARGGSRQTVSATMAKRSLFTQEQWAETRKAQEEAAKQLSENLRNWPQEQNFGNFNLSLVWGRGRLGVNVETLTDQLAEYFGAKDGGVLVVRVNDNTPAAKAGLKAGDVIVSVDGEKVRDVSALTRAIGTKEEGQLALQVLRDRREVTVTVTIEKVERPRRLRTVVPRRVVRATASA